MAERYTGIRKIPYKNKETLLSLSKRLVSFTRIHYMVPEVGFVRNKQILQGSPIEKIRREDKVFRDNVLLLLAGISNSKAHSHKYQTPPMFPSLSKILPHSTLVPHFIKIHPNIIFLLTSWPT